MTALLQAEGVTIRFGGILAVADLNLSLDDAETVCIVGPNGAGKSTLLNALTGAVRPQAGSIRLDGEEMTGRPVKEFARRGIARKFQAPSVFGSLSTADNLDLALRQHVSRSIRSARIGQILGTIGLSEVGDRPASHLSHGQKQWLEIGMALVGEPRLVLLDEPTAGMGPEETILTALLLIKLAQRMAVIVIEHDMDFVRALACRTMVMHHGRVIASGPFQDIAEDPMVRDVYLGRA